MKNANYYQCAAKHARRTTRNTLFLGASLLIVWACSQQQSARAMSPELIITTPRYYLMEDDTHLVDIYGNERHPIEARMALQRRFSTQPGLPWAIDADGR